MLLDAVCCLGVMTDWHAAHRSFQRRRRTLPHVNLNCQHGAPAGLPQCRDAAGCRLTPQAASLQAPTCRLLPSLARLLACHDEEIQHNAAWAVHALAKHSTTSRDALLRCPNLLPAVIALLHHPAQPVASAAVTAVAHFAHEPTSAVESLRLPSMATLAEQLQHLLGSPSPEAQEGASAAVVSLARTSEAHAGLLLQQKGLPGRLVELMSAGTGKKTFARDIAGTVCGLQIARCT